MRFAGFYLVGGLVAELVYIAMSPDRFQSAIPMGGASGAISSCMGMYLLLRAEADIEFKYFLWLFYMRAGEFEIPAWMAISFWFLRDLLWAVLGLVYPHNGGGVAFGAHVGGFLAGLALIGIFKLGGRRAETDGKKAELIIDPRRAMRVVLPPAKTMATSEVPTIYLHDGTAQSGPFTLTQVQNQLQCGSVSLDASYWSEGLSEWQNVADLASHPLA